MHHALYAADTRREVVGDDENAGDVDVHGAVILPERCRTST
jgi:hypothetical protein